MFAEEIRAAEEARGGRKELGFVMMTLWEAGLKFLPYGQLRGFLKQAGFHDVPRADALERYAQLLGLKKYAT